MANEKKNAALGMNVSTATAQLKKFLMFEMLCELGRNVCYQCSQVIESAEHLSVEHKVPWLSSPDPKEAFWDRDNIAFSHLTCNSAAASRPNKIYTDDRERGRVNFAKYYSKNSAKFLRSKRDRYHAKRHLTVRQQQTTSFGLRKTEVQVLPVRPT